MKQGQYRYGFTPLHVGNHDDAKIGEYMCDPITGSPGMKMEDGTIISIGELDRLANHRNTFTQKIAFQGVDYTSVYLLENTVTKEIIPGQNILDDIVSTGRYVKYMLFSIDADILENGANDVRAFSQYNPLFHFEFTTSNGPKTADVTYTDLKETPILIDGNDVIIDTIYMVEDENAPTTLKCILHSILMAM